MLAFAILAVAPSGCGSGEPSQPDDLAPMYVEYFDMLRANPPSDLIASVVDDYEVSDVEFAEAQQAYRECVSARAPGSNPQAYADGSTDVTLPDSFIAQFGEGDAAEEAANTALGEIADECGQEGIYEVAFLYFEPDRNPWGYRNFTEALRACFEVVDSDFGSGVADADLLEQVMAEGFMAPTEAVAECVADPLTTLKDLGQ
jgi:hypothetical protein